MIYYVVGLFIFISSLLSEFSFSKQVKLIIKWCVIITIIIFGGTRFEVGADWSSYREIYNTANETDILSNGKEHLFLFLNFLVNMIGVNFSAFVFLIFLISFNLKYWYVNKFKFNVPLSILIYFFTLFIFFDINGIRQGIAIGFLFLTIPANINRQFIKFFTLVLIASFFHYTAIVYLPFYFISNYKITPIKTFLIVSLTYILSFFVENILINSIFGKLVTSYENLQHYNYYVDNSETPVVNKFGLAVISRFIILFIFIGSFYKLKISDNLKNLFLNSYVISILIFLLLSFNQDFANRLSYYFRFVEIILIPLIIYFETSFGKRLFYIFLFGFIYFLSFLRIMLIHDNGLLPYSNSLINIFS